MNTHKQYALFRDRIDSFTDWKLTAAATAVSERAWPNFALFSELAEYGDSPTVRHCLNMLWDNIAGHQSSKNFERLLEKIDDNTPNPDDFDMFGVQPALDAIVSINCAINCAMTPSHDEAASALTLSLSTIGKFIRYAEVPDLNGTELAQYIEEHDLYKQHMGFLDNMLDILKTQKKQNPDFMKEVRAMAQNDGISQLGISLD
ncbi:hypothetical protein GZ77_10115 [Endozoicomonas montiporae]|uniref:DUF416 domain-containing protein n=2 Tax=Endozoicomonas montiporae TaxID=1027273 RepID=A0A081N887_9GAMM|nr:DUF416 family protein [Endozoicomonas montiporae]AMO55453.1 hypothetical protein EZMO1_1260 [Endozoicomonas montiporae CL-33]KEQ14660.1 hypothetical protein GZ77_10115 [Endozoicomonas montiporae]